MFTLHKPKFHIELTDKCNAKCPQCRRTDKNGLGNQSFIQNQEITLQTIQQSFDGVLPSFVNFCGNYGDPIIATDIDKIIEYFINKGSKIDVSTNGSLRNEEWWERLGKLGRNLQVCFGIDGITQETHEMYRRNTNLQKILNNALAFNLAGGRSTWQWLNFNHNYKEVEEARLLAKQYGFTNFSEIDSNRFYGQPDTTYIYNNQSYSLKPSPHSRQLQKPPTNKELENITKVSCSAEAENYIYIAANGDVWPCCHTAAFARYFDTPPNIARPNIYTQSMVDIINTDFFVKFKQKRANELSCKVVCGAKYRKVGQVIRLSEQKS